MVVLNGSSITTTLSFTMFAASGSSTQSITVQNEGDENLMISGIHVENDTTVTSGTFSAGGYGTLPLVLAPWSSRTIDVTLRWTGGQSGIEVYTAGSGWIPEQNYLRISSNDSASPEYTVQLSALVF
ncbi:MAG: hypothetical protein H6741_11210 [Alphaproteobacteria bacterium]|nr:hypothetical protein [Alphaproteobacteria bacterium]